MGEPSPLASRPLFWACIVLLVTCLMRLASSCTFTISNNCPDTIWPGTLSGAGTPQLSTTGFRLEPGKSVSVAAPPRWSGRIWARTGCMFDAGGAGTCQTGDCGGRMECGGAGALPPATLFEITLGEGAEEDYYDVSLVDGYNLPLMASPRVARCNATGCAADLNLGCPKELQVEGGGGGGGVVACKSACEAFGFDRYCCSGEFANPATCQPSFYSAFFKRACPRAYSYAFDDGTSTFTCQASDYTIVFCPANNNGLRRSNEYAGGNQPVTNDANQPSTNGTQPVTNAANQPNNTNGSQPVTNGANQPITNGGNQPVTNGGNQPIANGNGYEDGAQPVEIMTSSAGILSFHLSSFLLFLFLL